MSAPAAPGRAPAARSERVGFWVVLAGALALRLWHLGARSVWTDEGSTWTASSGSLQELLRLCAFKDASPPLFYLLTSLSLRFGSGEFQLRLVSALASVGMVWLTYRFARLAEGRRAATLAAALCAVAPYAVMYGQEGRTYSLAALLAVASLYLFVRAALFGARRAWVWFAVVSTLALYTQALTLLSVGVQAALVVFDPRARRRVLPWLAVLGVSVALYLPWTWIAYEQLAHLGSSHWYLRSPGWPDVFRVLRAAFVSPLSIVSPPAGSRIAGLGSVMPRHLAQLLVAVVVGTPLVAAARVALSRQPRAEIARIAWAAVMLPLAAVLAVSVVRPLWNVRYFVLVTPFVAVLQAQGLASLHPRAMRMVWGLVVFALSGFAWLRYDVDYTKEPWRDVAAAIQRETRPGRTAVLVTFDVDPFRFYSTKMASPPDVFEVSHPRVPFADAYTPGQLDEMERRVRAETREYEDVWVVIRSPNSPARLEVARRAERVAGEERALVERRVWESAGGPLRVARYRRAPAGP